MEIRGIFGKNYIVGLDIGSSSIKMAQFVRKEGGLYLIHADLKELISADDARREDEIVSFLRDLSKGADFKKSEVIASINCPRTALKKATVPYMPRAELYEGIALEAKNYFPFSVEGAAIDFEIVGDIVEKGVRKYEIIVAASPKKTVEKYLELLKKAGIKAASCVPASYALKALAGQLATANKPETICLLDMGAINSELLIYSTKGPDASGAKWHRPVFSRKIPVTAEDFTKAMTGALASDRGRTELTFAEAEKIKREAGIPSEGEVRIIDDKISTTQVLSMLRAPLDQLVSEIERCFDYYREESGGGKIDSLALFGGGASLGGLIRFLSEGLGIEVKLGDSLEGLRIEPNALGERNKISHRLGLAVGAALTGGKGINLLPPEIKEETKRVVKRGAAEAIITAAVIISVLLYTGMRIQLTNFQKRIAVSKLELFGRQLEIKKAQGRILASNILADEPHWRDVFRELSNIIPEYVYLEEMEMSGNIISMKGIVAHENGEEILSGFMRALEKGIFKDVTMVNVRDLGEKPGSEFELNCKAE